MKAWWRPFQELWGARQASAALTDAEALERYAKFGDSAAFEVLVWRHASMVFTTCRRVLNDTHDAEDAFQATFLILARKAASVRKREALASWLHGVAHRVAISLLRKRRRRRDQAALPDETLIPDPRSNVAVESDLRATLDAEIQQLPRRYRSVVVLCNLEEKTAAEAARELGCAKGTVLARLHRARAMLRGRLTRRGLTLSAPILTALAEPLTASAQPAAEFVKGVVVLALQNARGPLAVQLLSPTVLSLTQGVLNAMWWKKVQTICAVLIATIALAGTAWWGTANRAEAANPPTDGLALKAPAPVEPRENVEVPKELAARTLSPHSMFLLSSKQIRDEIGWKREDYKKFKPKLAEIRKNFEADLLNGFQNLPLGQEPDFEAMNKAAAERMGAALDKELRIALTEKQLTRLREVDLQLNGPHAFQSDRVAAALKLTDTQKEHVAKVAGEFANHLVEQNLKLYEEGSYPDEEDVQELLEGSLKKMKAANEAILSKLDDTQRAVWTAAIGKAFKPDQAVQEMILGGAPVPGCGPDGCFPGGPAMPIPGGIPPVPPLPPNDPPPAEREPR